MSERKQVVQCKTCPWKVEAKPLEEIPNGYSVGLHKKLKRTIAEPGSCALRAEMHVMACHYSKIGAETPCAGWLDHQLGPGNNIALRLRVMPGAMPVPVTEGPQHETFEATIPKTKRKQRR